jgi:hypothetical protein
MEIFGTVDVSIIPNNEGGKRILYLFAEVDVQIIHFINQIR